MVTFVFLYIDPSLMSTTRKIAHNTLIQIIGKAISTVLGLIVLAMMTRYLGQEKFGWYITTIAFLQFVAILIDFGLVPVTAQMMSSTVFEKKKLFQNLLAYRFFSALLFLGVAPLVALFFPYPTEVKIAIAFSTISFLSVALNQVLIGFYQTQLKMYIPTVGELLGRIFLLIGVYFFIQTEGGFLPIMGVVAASSVVYTLFIWVKARTMTSVGFSFDLQIWKAITAKMWPIAISIIFNVVYLKGDVLILAQFREQTEVGLYGAAYRVLDVVTQTAMMLMGVMLPLLAYAYSQDNRENFKKHFQMAFDSMMLLAFPMMIGIMVLADKIMLLVAGEAFLQSGIILRILSIAVFGVYLGAVFGHTAVSIEKQKQTIWVYISSALITLLGYLFLIPPFGMYAAAWMTVFSEIYVGFFLYLTVRHYSKVHLEGITFAKIVFSSLVMGATLFLFQHLNIFFLIPLGVIIYGFFALSLGVVSKDTLKEVFRINVL
ncbi:MAG: hypothetical protein COV59_00120 [Candidatus Magasanikbacteria bacterium CG11_big_fil_rev_8_21_14_0_20_39_34]|uniref:Uncharacterized protein n=1 Tax=Candidatus Magasanikbacteria bacterium CG11_big_fil_rev_8_21_14_0_20_39_34 TaxID=1974653 RepID=A0A2H0N6I6_9BACT|nr:MAG: hypothetical protein COV59_00120 [Candidatus Magasanikbacteria bacterium CG11_big_fil_rev_8_21_14_0_20_39_34]